MNTVCSETSSVVGAPPQLGPKTSSTSASLSTASSNPFVISLQSWFRVDRRGRPQTSKSVFEGCLWFGVGILFAQSPAYALTDQKANLILLNGRIWTENPEQSEATGVAIAGNRILAVGDDRTVRRAAAPGARIIDLHGRRVTPGFNDSHVHFLVGGASLSGVQAEHAPSAAALKAKVARVAARLPLGEWIVDGGWDHQRWAPSSLPTHALIDDVTPRNPVFLYRTDGHMALANAAAMKLAHIDRNTVTPQGGEIVRDESGDPTGIFKDAALGLITRVIPPRTERQLNADLSRALQEAASHGVTSVQNMANSDDDVEGTAEFRVIQEAERQGRLTVRIYFARGFKLGEALEQAGISTPFGSPRLRIGLLKGFADGAAGSETAWMKTPYLDRPGFTGLPQPDLQDPDLLLKRLESADKAGLQIAFHAIGDRANHEMLDIYERLEAADGPADRRLRIEHAQHLDPADYARFAKLQVVASMQPYHAIDDGRWIEGLIGPERAKSSYAWRSLLDKGVPIAFSSDWPVAPLDPLGGIYAAVTRETLDGKNPHGWVPEQRISVAEAVHAYTVGSAFAEFEESTKGKVKAGMLADLAVLSDDIFLISPSRLKRAAVQMTIFDGSIIYGK